LSFSSFLRFFSSSFCRFWYPKLGFAKLCSPCLKVHPAKRTDHHRTITAMRRWDRSAVGE
jgi:hypothetical protein